MDMGGSGQILEVLAGMRLVSQAPQGSNSNSNISNRQPGLKTPTVEVVDRTFMPKQRKSRPGGLKAKL